LIADDDPGIRSFLRRGLKLEGYGVIEAASGEAAVALTQDAKPDLVVLDWMMPGIDGPEALRQIRARNASVPVILFSSQVISVGVRKVWPWALRITLRSRCPSRYSWLDFMRCCHRQSSNLWLRRFPRGLQRSDISNCI
jgi:chemotaxis response regulator CheB